MSREPGPFFAVGPDRVRLLRDGAEAFPAMLEAIRRAEREVVLEMYWIGADRTGHAFLDALVERARAGVAVRVRYDAIGSMGLPASFFHPLRAAGGEVAVHAPLAIVRPRWGVPRAAFRDHRKILVVDGLTGFTGGINLGDDWGEVEHGGHDWRDDAIEVRGPAARELRALFFESWRPRWPGAAPTPDDVEHVRRMPTGPVRVLTTTRRHGPARSLRKQYVGAVRGAQRSIDIANAYFVPDVPVLRALRHARRRGVEVRVLVPAQSDLWVVSAATRGVVGALLRRGIRVFAYEGRVLHVKTAIFDDRLATVGSCNLDVRSFRYNLECNVAVEDETFARHVRASFERDLASSREITLESWRERPFGDRALAWAAWSLRKLL